MTSPQFLIPAGDPAFDWLHAVPTPMGFGVVRQEDRPCVALSKILLPQSCWDYVDALDYDRDFLTNPRILHMQTGHSQLNMQASEGWHRDPNKSGLAREEFEFVAERFFPDSPERPTLIKTLSLGFAQAAAATGQRHLVIEFKVYGPTYEPIPWDLHIDDEDFFTTAAYVKGDATIALAPPNFSQLRSLTRAEMPKSYEPHDHMVSRYKRLHGRSFAAWPMQQLHESPASLIPVPVKTDKTRIVIFGFASRLTPEPAL